MKVIAVLAYGMLTAALVPGALGQDNEAEKLFRDMEKKITAAKAIQVTADIELRAIKGREKESKIGDGVSKGKGKRSRVEGDKCILSTLRLRRGGHCRIGVPRQQTSLGRMSAVTALLTLREFLYSF
jgi:hypothetical protein